MNLCTLQSDIIMLNHSGREKPMTKNTVCLWYEGGAD